MAPPRLVLFLLCAPPEPTTPSFSFTGNTSFQFTGNTVFNCFKNHFSQSAGMFTPTILPFPAPTPTSNKPHAYLAIDASAESFPPYIRLIRFSRCIPNRTGRADVSCPTSDRTSRIRASINTKSSISVCRSQNAFSRSQNFTPGCVTNAFRANTKNLWEAQPMRSENSRSGWERSKMA